MRASQTFERPPAVVASVHDDGLVLFHTGIGRLFTANRTGARIWQCLERNLPVDAIAAEIGRDYRIADGMATEHTTRFLTELQRQGLIAPGAKA